MQRKSQWKDKCVGTLRKTQKWKLSQGSSIHFLLHFESPESLVYFYRSLVWSRRGAVPGRWKSFGCICGITARAALFWASGLNLKFLHENYIHAPFWPFLTLYCVAPKQYQLVILSFCFVLFFSFKTRLVRPGKILVIRIHAGTAGYAARVPPDLFAIAQTDLRESDATLIAPNLRVRKNGTVPQGDTWGPVMSTMSCNVFRWGPLILKAASPNWNVPPYRVRIASWRRTAWTTWWLLKFHFETSH